MSYIGKNPTADDLTLTGTGGISIAGPNGITAAAALNFTVSATAPGTPAEGMMYYNDGTGAISEGLKVYKNGSFVQIDKQLGDADTIALKKAVDVGGLQWAVAINSTSTTVGMNAPVPQYNATATGFIAASTFLNTSTGNALLTDESADLVFAYESHTTNSKNDYYGVQIDIPAAFRGGNLVLSFEYRTAEASAATSDDDFRVAVQDHTNKAQTTAHTGMTGSQAAGTSILVVASAGFAVGDKVWVESGTANSGLQANDFTEAYVTEVVDATHLKFSETIIFPATLGGLIVSGWLTDKVPGQLQEADSDTNKVGKKRSIQFKTEETTETVNVTFQNLSTSAAGIDLFVDNILLSANKFLQASSSPKAEAFRGTNLTLFSSANTRIPEIGTVLSSTLDNLVTFASDSTVGASFTVNQDCVITGNLNFKVDGGVSTGENFGWSVNSTELSSNIQNITAAHILMFDDPRGGVYTSVAFTNKFSKGDIIRPHGGNSSGTFQDEANWRCFITAEPQVNDVIILESQDEIFTDWVSYTPTITGWGTVSVEGFRWRRVGDTMEVIGAFTSGSSTATLAIVDIPSGYSIDHTKQTLNGSNGNSNCGFYMRGEVSSTYHGGGLMTISTSTNGIYFDFGSFSGGSGDALVAFNASSIGSSGNVMTLNFKVPIQGWNANFNPLLSMPLADFGTFENTYSARIAVDGTINSQSGNWLSSVNHDSTGNWTLTLTSGFFTQTPSAIVDANHDVTGGAMSWIKSSSSSQIIVRIGQDGVAYTDRDFSITVQRQGSDYRDPPQATAAIIKPAVAILKDVKAYNVDGGTNTVNWETRTLNTLEGESWFVVLASNQFTLEPGTYKINATSPAYKVNSFAIRLYDVTNSAVVKYGSGEFCYASDNVQTSSKLFSLITIGSSTEYRIEIHCDTAQPGNGLGVQFNEDATAVSVYTQVQIEKLK